MQENTIGTEVDISSQSLTSLRELPAGVPHLNLQNNK